MRTTVNRYLIYAYVVLNSNRCIHLLYNAGSAINIFPMFPSLIEVFVRPIVKPCSFILPLWQRSYIYNSVWPSHLMVCWAGHWKWPGHEQGTAAMTYTVSVYCYSLQFTVFQMAFFASINVSHYDSFAHSCRLENEIWPACIFM